MSTPYDRQIEELLDEYRKKRDEAVETQRQIGEITATVTAPKQVVKVTVNAQGEVSAIEFPTSAFRRLSPKELATTLVTTIQQARANALEKATGLASDRLPAGVTIAELLQGKANPTDLLPVDPGTGMPDSVREYVDNGRSGGNTETER
jgi:DNA-binding protein YbaB